MLARTARFAACSLKPTKPHSRHLFATPPILSGPKLPTEPPPSVLRKHPRDPANHFRPPPPGDEEAQPLQSSVETSSPSPPSPSEPSGPTASDEHNRSLPLVPTQTSGSSSGPLYTPPPFDTHRFVSELERTFPTPAAQSLMRATRSLLVDRVGRVRREALTSKDLENQAYLFRAALSELRAEFSLHLRNESTGVRASAAMARKELDRLDANMKQAIDTLKHEIQLELDSRKTEFKTEYLKRQDISIEELQNKYMVELSDLRAKMEENKWENMRRSIITLSAFLITILVAMELRPKPKPPPPPVREIKHPEAEGLERTDWVT